MVSRGETMVVGAKEPLGVVIVADHSHQGKLKPEWLLRTLGLAFPWLEVTHYVIDGPLVDEMGRTRWFDPKSGAPNDRAKRVKLLRRDLMTGVSEALRM